MWSVDWGDGGEGSDRGKDGGRGRERGVLLLGAGAGGRWSGLSNSTSADKDADVRELMVKKVK